MCRRMLDGRGVVPRAYAHGKSAFLRPLPGVPRGHSRRNCTKHDARWLDQINEVICPLSGVPCVWTDVKYWTSRDDCRNAWERSRNQPAMQSLRRSSHALLHYWRGNASESQQCQSVSLRVPTWPATHPTCVTALSLRLTASAAPAEVVRAVPAWPSCKRLRAIRVIQVIFVELVQ